MNGVASPSSGSDVSSFRSTTSASSNSSSASPGVSAQNSPSDSPGVSAQNSTAAAPSSSADVSDLPGVSAQNSTAAPTSSSADSPSPSMSVSASGPARQLSLSAPSVKTPTTPEPPVKTPTASDNDPSTTMLPAAAASSSSHGDAPNSSPSAKPSPPAAVKSSSSPGPKSSAVGKPSSQAPSAKPAGPTSSPAPPPTSPIHGGQVSFTGTTTSTITDPPESTLSKPSFIPIVQSDGKTSFTAPPLVTILSTSREPDGSFTTFTHIVANPTGFSQAISGGHASFFNNAGAVAGVFLVVGGFLTALAAFGIFIMCRRRRRRRERHRRWLISINRPRNLSDVNDPFESPRSAPSPPIRVVPPAWDTESRQEMSESGLGLYNVPQTQEHRQGHAEPEPQEFEQLQAYYDGVGRPRQQIGLAISTNMNQSKPSLAQSSPSIYPPSLPPVNDDRPAEAAPLPLRRYSSEASVAPAPPRPRRSHLRESSKAQLVTPPSSVSSHSPVSEFSGPFGFTSVDSERATSQHEQLNEIMGRRTLLDEPRQQCVRCG
ncbi:hypothetical protein C8R46DRAFT_215738 [Mycena filopes]|nr:hypothetical protein C8R46DRAFT_215738 [Mycena filopes]